MWIVQLVNYCYEILFDKFLKFSKVGILLSSSQEDGQTLQPNDMVYFYYNIPGKIIYICVFLKKKFYIYKQTSMTP